jgi:hypothetical protein
VSEKTARNCRTGPNFSFEGHIRTFYLTEKQRQTRLKFARRALEYERDWSRVLKQW